jgi:tRNA modification GTPase
MLTEATLDFPDEEIDLLRETDARGELARVRHDLAALVARARQGQLLREGVRVALIGRPNVGKSSLLNQLAGDEVAIVTPIPGTTRDAIRQEIEVQGVPLHVIDTAGLREAADEVERIGIARTWRVASEADVAVLIVEAARGVDVEEQIILGRLPTALRVIVVHNKIDLSGAAAGRFLRDGREHVYLSAKTGEGVDLFGTALLDTVGGQGESNEAFTARERHVRALLQARDHLAKAAEHVDARTTAIELFAEELRLAQQALTAITGEFSADDLLGEIFSRFCIGK